MFSPSSPLPRGPVLDWSSFRVIDAPGISSIENLAHTAYTTSGRAAIFQALMQLQLPAASTVLVPTYHCPTIIAPVMLANLNVAYFGLRADGLPNLDTIDAATAVKSKAMIVSHYFGLAHSLAEVRQWCDDFGIALVEDCAHCYFGEAGERPIGAWGDYSTASLSKFFPVPEAGLLASAHHPIESLQLSPQSLKAQIKGWVDVFEPATKYKRFRGLNSGLAVLFRAKNSHLQPISKDEYSAKSADASMMHECDMSRISHAPLGASMILKSILPRGRIIARRQQNFASYAGHFAHAEGARSLFPLPSKTIAPYVFPLWVDEADRVYHALRAQALPVFRWDKVWPDTPQLDGDVGPLWSQHVLQLPCHQDLSEADIDRTSNAILGLLPHKQLTSGSATQYPFRKNRQAMEKAHIHWKNLPASSLQQETELLSAWDRLNAVRCNLPFLAANAIVSALKILGDGTERLLVGNDGTRVVTMFLLTPLHKFQWRTFQPSQLPLGAWVAEAHLDLPDISRSLMRGPLGFCLGLSITQIDPLVAPRGEDTSDSLHTDYIDTGWIDIEGTFDEYWSARGKNLRQNMRKQRAKLLADGVKLTMQILRDHDDMAPAITRYGSLESFGWKAKKGTAIHPDNAQGRYYRELLEHASLHGEAAVYQYLFDDRIVAMNLCLVRQDTLIVLKTTYDESINAYSPAFLLRENELQDIYSAGQVKRVEYFGRLMDWHIKLTDKKRTIYHLTLYRWPFVKMLAEARRKRAHTRIPAPVDEEISTVKAE